MLFVHIRVMSAPCPTATATFLLSRVKPLAISTSCFLQFVRLVLNNDSSGALSRIAVLVVVTVAFPAALPIAFHDAAFAAVILIRAVLRTVSLRFAEQGFGCGDRGTEDANVDFDHAPQVDWHAVEEGVFGFGVDANRVEAHD